MARLLYFVSKETYSEYVVLSEDADTPADDFAEPGFELEREFPLSLPGLHHLPTDRPLRPD